MRASGLGHVLSISGLHMALVAGSTFWLIRALLALSPGLALTRPIKKWAAAGALAVATFYLAISGGGVATAALLHHARGDPVRRDARPAGDHRSGTLPSPPSSCS